LRSCTVGGGLWPAAERSSHSQCTQTHRHTNAQTQRHTKHHVPLDSASISASCGSAIIRLHLWGGAQIDRRVGLGGGGACGGAVQQSSKCSALQGVGSRAATSTQTEHRSAWHYLIDIAIKCWFNGERAVTTSGLLCCGSGLPCACDLGSSTQPNQPLQPTYTAPSCNHYQCYRKGRPHGWHAGGEVSRPRGILEWSVS